MSQLLQSDNVYHNEALWWLIKLVFTLTCYYY